MKNNLNYKNERPFTNLSNVTPIEITTTHCNQEKKDTSKKNNGSDNKTVSLVALSIVLGVLATPYMPSVLTPIVGPIGILIGAGTLALSNK